MKMYNDVVYLRISRKNITEKVEVIVLEAVQYHAERILANYPKSTYRCRYLM